MNPGSLLRLAGRLMRHPAAPYFEHDVRAEVEKICAEHGLEFERDSFGNVFVRLRTSRKLRQIVFAAHMDHPGFEVLKKLAPKRFLARFRGGVPDSYFRAGTSLRLMPGKIPASLGRAMGVSRDLRFGNWRIFQFAAERSTGALATISSESRRYSRR
jgi:hypothetical protein